MSFELQRERLVENELRILGIRDEAVLRAMRIVPREVFVSDEMQEFAYRNAPLPWRMVVGYSFIAMPGETMP